MQVQFTYLDNETVLGHKRRCEILRTELEQRGHIIVERQPDWVIYDHPNNGVDYPIPEGAQRLVMGQLPVQPEDWGWHPLHLPAARTLTGVNYLILDPYLIDLQNTLPEEADYDVIVTLGGRDPFHLTEKLIALFAKEDWSASFVVGPNFKRDIVLPDNATRLRLLQGLTTDDLLLEFTKHGYAITGWGNATFEAVALGCHTVPIVLDNAQADEAACLDLSYVTRKNIGNVFNLLEVDLWMPTLPLDGVKNVVDFMEAYYQ